MILLLSPTPSAWEGPLQAALAPHSPLRLLRVPPPLRRAGTAWTRGDAGRRVRLQLRLRRHLDQVAAGLLHGVDLVVAPTLGARRTFAAARAKGIRTLLVEDLPDLRGLHAALDQAAGRHPDAPLLHRYRAPDAALRRQEEERALADAALVASPQRAAALARQGVPAFPFPHDVPLFRPPKPGSAVLFSGLPVARNGSLEALEALEGRVELRFRRGEAQDPEDLFERPGVREVEADPLDGVGVVIAPAWVSGRHPWVLAAARAGVPVVGTDPALGWVDPLSQGAAVPAGDTLALREATLSLLGQRMPAWKPDPSGLPAWLCEGGGLAAA